MLAIEPFFAHGHSPLALLFDLVDAVLLIAFVGCVIAAVLDWRDRV